MRTLFLFSAAYRARRHIAICILLFLSAVKIVQAVFIYSIFKKINIFLKRHKLNNFFSLLFTNQSVFLCLCQYLLLNHFDMIACKSKQLHLDQSAIILCQVLVSSDVYNRLGVSVRCPEISFIFLNFLSHQGTFQQILSPSLHLSLALSLALLV